MNTGIGDAINLAWKLAAVLAGRAPQSLLASYEVERIAFARRLVATTDRAFSFVTSAGPFAAWVRTRVAPFVISRAVAFKPFREFLFRTVSQVNVNYRGMPLSAGSAGRVHGGDRLPWVHGGSPDNFAPLAAMTWQVHVYGKASDTLVRCCASRSLPLHVFPWSDACGTAGLARDALYLLRPDTYVALVEPAGDGQAVERYFTERGIQTASANQNQGTT
jgi:hypothetical protein